MNRSRGLAAGGIAFLQIALGGCESSADRGQNLAEVPFASVVEDLRIGAVDDPEYSFGAVVALEVHPNGEIFSLHRQEFSVRRWTPDGRSRGTIGRSGEGPGEFTQPWGLGWHGDSLWVFDSSRNSRITFFDGEGAYIGALTPQVDLGSVEQSRQGVFPARPAGLLADLTIYAVTPGFSQAIVDGTLTSIAHVRMDPEGRTLDTLLTTPVGRANVLGILRDGGGTFTNQAFGDADIALVENDRNGMLTLERKAAPTGALAEFRLTRINLEGDTLFSRVYSYQPAAIPSDTVRKTVDSTAEGLHSFIGERTGTSLEQWRGWVRDALYVPDSYTPISQVVSGRDGTIWLARNPTNDAGVEWLILDRSGEPIARAETPLGFRLMAADRSSLWGVVRDELDVEYIVRYRLELPQV